MYVQLCLCTTCVNTTKISQLYNYIATIILILIITLHWGIFKVKVFENRFSRITIYLTLKISTRQMLTASRHMQD